MLANNIKIKKVSTKCTISVSKSFSILKWPCQEKKNTVKANCIESLS